MKITFLKVFLFQESHLKESNNLFIVFVRSGSDKYWIFYFFPFHTICIWNFINMLPRLLIIYPGEPSLFLSPLQELFFSDTVLFQHLLFPCLDFLLKFIICSHVLSIFCTFVFTILLFNSLAKIPAPKCSLDFFL